MVIGIFILLYGGINYTVCNSACCDNGVNSVSTGDSALENFFVDYNTSGQKFGASCYTPNLNAVANGGSYWTGRTSGNHHTYAMYPAIYNYTVCNIGSTYNSDNSENCYMPGEGRFKYNSGPNYTSIPSYVTKSNSNYTVYSPLLDSSGGCTSIVSKYGTFYYYPV